MFDLAAEQGLSEKKFLQMTPRQFAAFHHGNVGRERRQAELARAQAYLICSPNLKRGVSLHRFWPLPWDFENVPKFKPQDPAEAADFREKATRIFAQKRLESGNNQSA